MEYKIDDIISYNDEGETIYLKVTPTRDVTCRGCYFHGHKCHCSTIKNIVGECSENKRTDKQTVIFTKVNNSNNMKKKATIDIYVVMQVHKTHRSFCGVFTSFKEANARFETLLKNFKNIYKVQPKKWTIECLPSQIKVFIIGDITLYLYKETKEVEIEETIPEPVFDEPKFRSFFSSYNCFSESVKHVPFGVLINEENIYLTIIDISNYGISILNDNNQIERIDFEDASKLFKYADGSPFGCII